MPPRKKRAVQVKGGQDGAPLGERPEGQEGSGVPLPPPGFPDQEEASHVGEDHQAKRRTYVIHPGVASAFDRRGTYVISRPPVLGADSAFDRRGTYVISRPPILYEDSGSDPEVSESREPGRGAFFVGNTEDGNVGFPKAAAANETASKQKPGRRKQKVQTVSSSEGEDHVQDVPLPKKPGRKKKTEVAADHHPVPNLAVTSGNIEEVVPMDSMEGLSSQTDNKKELKILEDDASIPKKVTSANEKAAKPKKRGRPKKPLEFVADGQPVTVEVQEMGPIQEKPKKDGKKKEQVIDPVVDESEGPLDNLHKKPLKRRKK